MNDDIRVLLRNIQTQSHDLFALIRLAELLLAGAVMNQVLQPHESHIPFQLQFMIDHNLFGMNHIHVSAVKFRVSSSYGKDCTF